MPTPVSQQYAELMHYTTLAGLRGIVSSNCFWATDAAFLNDSSESTHFFETRLEPLVWSEVRRYAIELAQDPAKLARMVSDGGLDKIVAHEATELASRLRLATASMNKPYILSLSGPSDDRIRTSGLLSQWRGYGSDGGYALVLDTKRLEESLKTEAESHHYMHVQLGDVYYHGINPSIQPATPDVAESEEVVRQGVSRLVRGGTAEETPGFYESVTSLSCLCKHWGFWEEREVRVVVVPASLEVQTAANGSGPPAKAVKTFERGQARVPYVELFAAQAGATLTRPLPIKRVVVGPHRDRADRAKLVKEIPLRYSYDIDVVVSEIPYIGR